jgi:hypothetical protein
MERYNSFNSANQLHGSINAPIGILVCKANNGIDNTFAIMNLPTGIKILSANRESSDKEVVTIDPNAKVY